jgi:hypothetical protein
MEYIFDQCSFDVVTMANNYMYDYGPDELMDTRDLNPWKEHSNDGRE